MFMEGGSHWSSVQWMVALSFHLPVLAIAVDNNYVLGFGIEQGDEHLGNVLNLRSCSG